MQVLEDDTMDPRAAWNRAAPLWDEFVEGGADYFRTEVHGPALLAACGGVGGRHVLDVGCGQGWFARRLAEQGARVVGVDVAEEMIERALRHERARPLGIEYHHLDAVAVAERWPPGSFDLVTASMVLHDLPDPGAALAAVRRVVTPRGRVVASVMHPLMDLPARRWERLEDDRKGALAIDRYFESGGRIERWDMARLPTPWEVPQWRWTLEEWSGFVGEARLLIRRLREPRPTPEQIEREPKLEEGTRLPYFLLMELMPAPETAAGS